MTEISQQSTILKMLRKAGKKGVENYKFPQKHILRYSSRIKELRDDGHNIYTERVYLNNGRATNTFKYYLNEENLTRKRG